MKEKIMFYITILAFIIISFTLFYKNNKKIGEIKKSLNILETKIIDRLADNERLSAYEKEFKVKFDYYCTPDNPPNIIKFIDKSHFIFWAKNKAKKKKDIKKQEIRDNGSYEIYKNRLLIRSQEKNGDEKFFVSFRIVNFTEDDIILELISETTSFSYLLCPWNKN